MNELQEFRDFLLKERDAAATEERMESILAAEALVERGSALGGLRIARRSKGELVLRCDVNHSRLRPGGRVRVEGDVHSFTGTIQDIQNAGRTVILDAGRDVQSLPDGPWLLRETPLDLTPIFLQCLQKFQAGAPGWSALRLLTGQTADVPLLLREDERIRARHAVEAVCRELAPGFDASQRTAVERCVDLHLAFGVQGPPGTGKTRVLAVVAEVLVRLGRRVLIVAPTHQAVNNALSTIHAHFPHRHLVKIGDGLHRESLADDIPYLRLRGMSKELPADVLRETVLGMTVVSALCQFSLKIGVLAPHVILVDEAGQLPLVQGVCLALAGAGSLLLFGDDAQMPPVYASDVQDDPLAVSLFGQLRKVRPSSVVALGTTYRLNRELCKAVSTHFYGGPASLRPSPEAAGRRLSLSPLEGWASAALAGDRSLVWVRIDGQDARQENPAEAAAAADLVLACLGGGLPARDVVVVTPYRRQAAAIRRLLQDRLGPEADLPIVDTVERVQGLTVEVAVVSFCTSDPDHAADLAAFLFSSNRLNVAISRARCKAILVGSASLFANVPTEYNGLQERNRVEGVLRGAWPVTYCGEERKDGSLPA